MARTNHSSATVTNTMKTQIDIKSALLGMMIGGLAILAIGAATSSSETGRFQVSSGQGNAIIVDTQTGQAWGYTPATTVAVRNDGNFFDKKTQ